MDDIHEYLLLKGVDAVSIHGGKEQEERNEAIRLFKVRCPRQRTIHRSAWCGGDRPSARAMSSPAERSAGQYCLVISAICYQHKLIVDCFIILLQNLTDVLRAWSSGSNVLGGDGVGGGRGCVLPPEGREPILR